LGNIAQRTGPELRIDPKHGQIPGGRKAAPVGTRDQTPGWRPTV